MAFSRVAGILLHPTSLPGPGGIGTLGEHARRFVDTLERSGIGLWQVLPLGPTGYGDSPYSALSAFAGNPFLIALEPLGERGWLQATDFARLPQSPSEAVDFGELVPAKMAVLRLAFDRFDVHQEAGYHHFLQENAGWLDDFCLYMAIKDAHGGEPWTQWPADLRSRDAGALSAQRHDLAAEIDFHRFVQFIFFDQWSALKQYANQRNVEIVGDIPIFVAHDSADVWANQALFQLDERGLPIVVAGVPPDYFSPTGQLWGNPHYRWDVMAADGYQWWIDRFRMCLRLVDMVRLDHFRGFAAAWAVPYGNPTAELGQWMPSPGHELFSALESALQSPAIIAEDLGVITPDVEQLRATFGFPGMKILQFAFGAGPSGASVKLARQTPSTAAFGNPLASSNRASTRPRNHVAPCSDRRTYGSVTGQAATASLTPAPSSPAYRSSPRAPPAPAPRPATPPAAPSASPSTATPPRTPPSPAP